MLVASGEGLGGGGEGDYLVDGDDAFAKEAGVFEFEQAVGGGEAAGCHDVGEVVGGFDAVVDAGGVVFAVGDVDFVEPGVEASELQLSMETPDEAKAFAAAVGDEDVFVHGGFSSVHGGVRVGIMN